MDRLRPDLLQHLVSRQAPEAVQTVLQTCPIATSGTGPAGADTP